MSKTLRKTVLVTALSLGALSVAAHGIAKSNCPVEKCYGIVKKGKNDCGTPKHACAAQGTQSASKGEWMYVMKGNCDRIVGGSLKPAAANTVTKNIDASDNQKR